MKERFKDGPVFKRFDQMGKNNIIYEEKLFSKWLTIVLAMVTAYLLFMLVYQTPDWFSLIAFLLLLGATVNFSNLIIKFTSQAVSVSYGIFKYNTPWENIENCCLDETSVIRYGGWGIRIDRVKGKWRLVYNIVGGPRVILSLRKGKFKEFVFSTNNLQKVMEIVKQKSGMRVCSKQM